jgi:hypothetical protein
VRRIFAILLMAFLSFPLISPALLASDADSKLPACCRRSGSHHCSIMARQSHAAGPAIETGRCLSFPVATAFPGNPTVSSPGMSQAIAGALVSHPASPQQAEALCRISYSRAGQKRGPPTSIS